MKINPQHPGFGQAYLAMASCHMSMPEPRVLEFLHDHGLDVLAVCPGCSAVDFRHTPLCPISHTLQLMLGQAMRNMKPEEMLELLADSEREFVQEKLGT